VLEGPASSGKSHLLTQLRRRLEVAGYCNYIVLHQHDFICLRDFVDVQLWQVDNMMLPANNKSKMETLQKMFERSSKHDPSVMIMDGLDTLIRNVEVIRPGTTVL